MAEKEVVLVEESYVLTADQFLAMLPIAQQKVVKAYAEAHGISCYDAFNELLELETDENIADRAR